MNPDDRRLLLLMVQKMAHGVQAALLLPLIVLGLASREFPSPIRSLGLLPQPTEPPFGSRRKFDLVNTRVQLRISFSSVPVSLPGFQIRAQKDLPKVSEAGL